MYVNTNMVHENKFLNIFIEFILSHFSSPIGQFPRKMMTYRSNGQFIVNTTDEVLKRCEQADFKDCRINAYPKLLTRKAYWFNHQTLFSLTWILVILLVI